MKFEPKGMERYAHQQRGLMKLIQTGGRCALLFDPGLGKTATALDFASVLALKAQPDDNGVREVRVLVTGPLAAVDTWVEQAERYVSDQVNVWSEVLGGSIVQRAEALASRGGNPYRASLKALGKKASPRAIGYRRSIAWYARADGRERAMPITPSEGPDGLGTAKPRLVIVTVNIDTFASRQAHKSGTKADLLLDAVKRFGPELVIVDEMHKIKGARSNSSRLLGRIADVVPRRVGLTGTVMPAGPMDVFAQWRFIDPWAFGHVAPDGSTARATFGTFEDRFAVKGGYMGREVVGYRNLDDMQKIMAKNSIVARKEDSLDLPPVMPPVIVPVHLTPAEQSAYDQMKKELKASVMPGREANVGNRLTQMMRLRQITSGHLPDDQGIVHTLGHSKVNVIKSIANDTLAGENRIVIFSVFTHEIDELEQKLAQKGTEIMKITGATPAKDRITMRKRFGKEDGTRIIMLAQIQTMSLAVNELVSASNAIFGSLSQARDEYIQAHDRLNRIGQTRPITFWYAIAPGTVDEVIMKTHNDRTNLESAVLAHIMDENDG